MAPGMPTDRLRRVYLRPLPDPVLGARYSKGARRRAAELQRFLRRLQEAAQARLALPGHLDLLVVDAADWGKLFSFAYGLPFARSRPGGPSVVAPARYPERLAHRFDEVFLRAAQEGARAPGDARSCLDLWVGHAWGRAAAELAGLATGGWTAELAAAYVFLGSLHGAGAEELAARALALARVGVAGGCRPEDLDTPASRLRLPELLWLRGAVSLRAAELWRRRAWELAGAWREALVDAGRGEAAQALFEVEPGARQWPELRGSGLP